MEAKPDWNGAEERIRRSGFVGRHCVNINVVLEEEQAACGPNGQRNRHSEAARRLISML